MDLWRYLVQSPNQSVTKYKVKLLIKKKKKIAWAYLPPLIIGNLLFLP